MMLKLSSRHRASSASISGNDRSLLPVCRAAQTGDHCPTGLPGFLLILLALTGPLLSACGTSLPTPQAASLRVVASQGVMNLAADLAAAHQVQSPHVTVQLQEVANSAAAEALLRAGRADLALVAGSGPRQTPDLLQVRQVGWDTLALIVHRDNPVTALDVEQARRVFRGRLSQWSALAAGWEDPIQVVTREQGSAARSTFVAGLMQGLPIAQGAVVMPGSREMADYVAGNPGAIGYLSTALVDDRLRAVALVDGPIDPGLDGRAGSGLVQAINSLVGPGETSQAALDFLAFALSEQGQAVVGRHYSRLDSY